MSRRHSLKVAVCLTLLVAPSQGGDVSAYEIETHKKISEVAATRSGVDERLKESLGISAGLDLKVRGQSLLEWIEAGSLHADDWTYPFNHFHNPLVDWSQAGLGSFYSAIVWGQTPNQGYPSWSWQNTRQYFLDSLTGTQKADRDLGLTMTFQGLGQLIHLIQDMASPAHTRSDPHLFYNYETLVKDVQRDPDLSVAQVFLDWIDSPSLGPGPGWQTLALKDLAPIPIARLVDTDLYNGANPAATIQPLMGLAEYTNANYFSEDRVFRENEFFWRFPYPRRSSVTEADYGITLGDGTPVTRQYFRKDFDGDSGYRLATVGFLRDYIQRYGLDPGRYGDSPALDEAVYRDYAERLLPRAVGYSTALLDYFFRGKLEARIAPDPTDAQAFVLTGKNASQEPLKDGMLKVFGDYASEERRELGSWTISGPVASGDALSDQTLSFRPPTDRPVPERYMVVYQGDLGEEKRDNPPGFGGAVIGKAAKYVGVLEQLFVNPADGDVYFRNGTLVTRLNVQSQLRPGSLVFLRSWGTRNDTFLVEGGVPGEGVDHFYVFTLNRPRPDQVFRDPPVATLVRGPDLFDPFFMLSQLPPFARPQVLNYRALLDDNLNVILPGDYCLDIPDPYRMEREECHALLVNHTARTVVFDLAPSTLGAPSAGLGFTGVLASMVLRLDASNPGDSRIVVDGFRNIYADNDSDRGYLGIVDGTGRVVTTLMSWEPLRTPYYPAPQRGGRHLLWVNSDDNDPEGNNTRVYLSSLVDGTSTEIGAGVADILSVWAASLLSVAPDHLLRTATPTYFVKGWTTDGTVVLPRAGTPGFPPEDPDLASMKRLADLPSGVSIPTISLWQVIEDPDLIR